MKLQPRSTTQTQTKKKKSGFTLIEVIAVLVLLGILAAIAVPRYIDMAENAKDRAIDAGIAEMNGREALTWGQAMLYTGGYAAYGGDKKIQENITTTPDIGTEYKVAVTNALAGTIQFQGAPATALGLTRVASTATSPGIWTR
jgi:prepilin-type N-terminal cleavage/methylation domain-containing protein